MMNNRNAFYRPTIVFLFLVTATNMSLLTKIANAFEWPLGSDPMIQKAKEKVTHAEEFFNRPYKSPELHFLSGLRIADAYTELGATEGTEVPLIRAKDILLKLEHDTTVPEEGRAFALAMAIRQCQYLFLFVNNKETSNVLQTEQRILMDRLTNKYGHLPHIREWLSDNLKLCEDLSQFGLDEPFRDAPAAQKRIEILNRLRYCSEPNHDRIVDQITKAFFAEEAQKRNPTDNRVISFPPDISMGWLDIGPWKGGLRYAGQAQGNLIVSKNQKVYLTVTSISSATLQWVLENVIGDVFRLSIYDDKAAGMDAGYLAKTIKPEELWLGGMEMTPKDLSLCFENSSLRFLGFTGTKVAPGSLQGIREANHLEGIHFNRVTLTSETCENLEHIPLKKLAVLDCEASIAYITEIIEHHDLEFIGMPGAPSSEDLLRAISGKKNLRILNLSGYQGNMGLMECLGAVSETLVSLNIEGTQADDLAIAALARAPRLKRLHLRNTKVSNASVRSIKNMPIIEYISVSGSKIDAAGIREIAGVRSIKRLELDKQQAGEGMLEHIKMMNPDCEVRVWSEIR